jgi:TAG lipase/steryl ester hydrolase/phospholipase A2/LPA acyltransferase
MRHSSYTEWLESSAKAAEDHPFQWFDFARKKKFDQRVIESRLQELKTIRVEGRADKLLFYFDEGLHGNMANMGAAEVYESSSQSARDLISEYVGELAEGLEQIYNLSDSELDPDVKRAFFDRASRAHGRSALMLSGAGSLAPFHMGVCMALHSQGLLPSVISGSSAGAIIAGIVCSHNDTDLDAILNSESLLELFNSLHEDYTEQENWLDGEDIRVIVENWIPDITFEEAFQRSGRHLCVSVSPAEMHQQSRTLNSITTPNVLLRETIQASCAVPGLISPVTLAARGVDGNRVPYVRSRSWVDGSVTDDLPTSRLRRIFGCNFFITSQTNPLILWSLQEQKFDGPMKDFVNFWQGASKEWVKAVYPYAQSMVQNIYPTNMLMRMWFSVFTQDYTADVNVIPTQRFIDPSVMLGKIQPEKALELVLDGEEHTWPHIERIRNSTTVGAKLDQILLRLTDKIAIGSRPKPRQSSKGSVRSIARGTPANE